MTGVVKAVAHGASPRQNHAGYLPTRARIAHRVVISSDVRYKAIRGLCLYAEDAMARRWSDLSDRSRRLIVAAAITEAILKTAVLIDLRRRPANQIRGSKRMWIVTAVLINSAGLGPLSYFLFGRQRPAAAVGSTAPGEGE